MMEKIEVDPRFRYVLFVRDADPERVAVIENSLNAWFEKPNKSIILNLKEGERVMLVKVKRKERNEAVH